MRDIWILRLRSAGDRLRISRSYDRVCAGEISVCSLREERSRIKSRLMKKHFFLLKSFWGKLEKQIKNDLEGINFELNLIEKSSWVTNVNTYWMYLDIILWYTWAVNWLILGLMFLHLENDDTSFSIFPIQQSNVISDRYSVVCSRSRK